MASNQAVSAAVTALCASAGMRAGQVPEGVYRQALATMTDTEVADATLYIVRTQRWEYGLRPSPALIVEAVHAARARSAARAPKQPPAGDVTPAHQLADRVAQARAAMHWRRTP